MNPLTGDTDGGKGKGPAPGLPYGQVTEMRV